MLARNLVAGIIIVSVLPLYLVSAGAVAENQAVREELTITTARKREENLQDVPISITSFSAEQIEAANITTSLDLANATPGLYFEAFNAGAASFPVLRGLSQQNISFDLAVDNNVGRFIDGIYQTNRNAPDLELLDLERIEVIKGPQSAMFGHSSFAGAINYVTRKPGDELEAKVKVGAGTDEDYMVYGRVSGPLIPGTLLGSVSAGYREFDGTFSNLGNPGDNLGGYENTTISGSLIYNATDKFSATLSGFFNDRDNEHSAQHIITAFNCGSNMFGGFNYFCGEVPFIDPVDLSADASGAENESWQMALTLEYDFSWATLTSVTAYSEQEAIVLGDADGTSAGQPHGVCDMALHPGTIPNPPPFPGFIDDCFGFFPLPPPDRFENANAYTFNNSEANDFSQEIRLQSNNSEGLNWLAGLYYFDGDNTTESGAGVDNTGLAAGEVFMGFGGLLATPDPINAPLSFLVFESGTEITEVFGQIGYTFFDKLDLSLEARYSNVEKNINSIINNFAPGFGQFDEDFDMWSTRFTADYQLNETVMVYGNVARGVRAGGFNGGFPADPAYANEATFDDESNWTYETGVKTTWSNLTANASIYFVDWDDMQISGLSEDPTFLATVIRNAGGVRSKGFEFDIQGIAADFLAYGAGYAYADPTFKSDAVDQGVASSCGPDICNLDPVTGEVLVGGNRLGRMAKNQFSAHGTLFGDINSEWRWSARADVNYSDEVFTRSINQQTYGDRTVVNTRLVAENDSLTISIWTRNLFDEEYIIANALQPKTWGVRATDHTQAEGRRAGISVEYRF
ncbi:MAG: TonB-dependent receptor [Gammaproteobacteria bacterium]|jgi:iron complex outermembrane receptor protein|nr:hypothetical protein [Chromatiales bacterium]MDP6675412.1 TonB-dependent receptor [Gammaproteobacteria bacterium]